MADSKATGRKSQFDASSKTTLKQLFERDKKGND